MPRLTHAELRPLSVQELEEALDQTSYFSNRQNYELLRKELDHRRQRPETKTWAFWLGLAGVLFGLLGTVLGSLQLARDYYGWGAKTPGSSSVPIPPPKSTPPPPAQPE